MKHRAEVRRFEQGIRAALGQLLEFEGYEVRTAGNATDGISEYEKWRPNLVFMDVKMADLDGFSATRRLADDDTTKHIPVIVVTASALIRPERMCGSDVSAPAKLKSTSPLISAIVAGPEPL